MKHINFFYTIRKYISNHANEFDLYFYGVSASKNSQLFLAKALKRMKPVNEYDSCALPNNRDITWVMRWNLGVQADEGSWIVA